MNEVDEEKQRALRVQSLTCWCCRITWWTAELLVKHLTEVIENAQAQLAKVKP